MPRHDLPSSEEFKKELAALVVKHEKPVDSHLQLEAESFPRFVILDGHLDVDETVNVSNGFEEKGGLVLRTRRWVGIDLPRAMGRLGVCR